MQYMVMDKETAECEIYNSKESANKNVKIIYNSKESDNKNVEINCFIFPIDIINNGNKAELILYSNAISDGTLPYVAEYVTNDLLNSDLQSATEDNPVKIYFA